MGCFLFLCFLALQGDSLYNPGFPDYLRNVYCDGKYIISSPLRWKKEDVLKSAVVIGTGCVIMTQDDKTRDLLGGFGLGGFFSLIEPLGREGAIIALSALYLGGRFSGNEEMEKIALVCGESVFISGIIVGGLKVLTGRARPFTGQGPYFYSPVSISLSHQSFPSIHTATAFSIASCLTERYDNQWVKILGYGGAFMVGLARVYKDKHWVSDTFFGGVIGFGVGKMVSRLKQGG